MTTPRIDEMVDVAVANFVFSGLSIEKIDKIPKWLLENIEKNKSHLQKALTQAHQAGIDEAVEYLRETFKDDCEIGVSHLFLELDTIKALQDKALQDNK